MVTYIKKDIESCEAMVGLNTGRDPGKRSYGRSASLLGCTVLIVIALYLLSTGFYKQGSQRKHDIMYIPSESSAQQRGNSTLEDTLPSMVPSGGRKMVILMSYMRGGSSLLGSLFDNNPAAMYWFEPVYGIYSAMAAAPMGTHPLRVVNDATNQPRNFTTFEMHFLEDHLTRILLCDLNELPVEFLTNLFMTFSKTCHSFRKCLGPILNKISIDCQEPIRHQCGYYISNSMKNGCHRYLQTARDFLHRSTSGSLPSMDGFPPVQDYVECIKPLQHVCKMCLQFLNRSCQKSKINVIKSIRLDFSTIENLFKRFPELYVIHEVRDPRAIVISRKLAKSLTASSLQEEARLLCHKMTKDILHRKRLEQKFPGRFLYLEFEDLIRSPLDVLERVYRHIEERVAEAVEDHLRSVTGTETSRQGIYLWKYKLRPWERQSVDDACENLFELTSYKRSSSKI